MPTKDQVTEALRAVIDPELRRDIVDLEMVRSIDIHPNGVVDVVVSLTTAGCPIRSHFQTAVVGAVRELDGVTAVNLNFDVLSDNEKAALGRKLVVRLQFQITEAVPDDQGRLRLVRVQQGVVRVE